MSRHLPKGTISHRRSGFAMIDPETELYHHKRGRAQHVAISYVWSEWQDGSSSGLPNWPLLRSRLLELVGKSASSFMRVATGNRINCWLDSKCIDQASSEDKAYWIPRMDQVYSEARCTVLLLRQIDLRPLVEAEKHLACDIDDDSHSCLLTLSCTAMTDLSAEQESSVISLLHHLYEGTWRKRAWIFQEILLSPEYILSGENNSQLNLSDCGVLAGLLSRKYPHQFWLRELAEWSRRLLYLRNHYHAYTLCAANILQMAQHLEATVQADRYYALCGVLRLKDLKYDSAHSAAEALQAVISELTKRGRLSWTYAIRPALNPDHLGALHLIDGEFSPYVFSRHCQNGSFYAAPQVTLTSIGFSVVVVGVVHRIESLSHVLQNTLQHVSSNGVNFPPDLKYMASVPLLLHKLAFESIYPLLQQPLLGRLHLALNLDPNASATEVVWGLYSLGDHDNFRAENINRPNVELSFLELALSASWLLKQRIASLQHAFAVVFWTKHTTQGAKEKSKAKPEPSEEIVSLGDMNTSHVAKVCRVRGDSILFAAEFDAVGNEEEASWGGVLLSLRHSDLDTGVVSAISRLGSWFSGKKGSRSTYLRFALTGERR